MKAQLSSLDVHFLVRELQPLVGGRLQKVYQGAGELKRDILFLFYRKEEEKAMLRVLLPGLVYLAEEKPEYETMPGPFATFLRRHIGNTRLIGVEQKSFERIIELKLENKDGVFTLVLELIPPGNALLLNGDGKIINLLEPQKTSSRVLRGGAIYEPPPVLFDTKAATDGEIAERLFASTKDSIVKSLAMDIGLGGDYAEEVCVRAGVDKGRKDLSKEELARVARFVKSLFEEPLAPVTFNDEAIPIAMRTKEGAKPVASFSHAICAIIPSLPAAMEKKAEAKKPKDKAAEVVKQQQAALNGLRTSSGENQRKGELLYEHYQEVEKLLRDIREAHKKHEWADIKKMFPNVKIDEAKGEITIELN